MLHAKLSEEYLQQLKKLAVCCEAVGCGGVGVHSVVSILFQRLAELWQNFQQTPPEQYLGKSLGADKRLQNLSAFH